jgi:hypothetical protein
MSFEKGRKRHTINYHQLNDGSDEEELSLCNKKAKLFKGAEPILPEESASQIKEGPGDPLLTPETHNLTDVPKEPQTKEDSTAEKSSTVSSL